MGLSLSGFSLRGLTLAAGLSLIGLAACAPNLRLSLDPTAELPVDPILHHGELSNGLSWYVQGGTKPPERAELRLVVRAGSNFEDEDQRGLAHVLEHMAFNGSAHFSGNELIRYFESIGMAFGAHVNAYTSFDETVYMLTVPTDRPEYLAQGLLVLRDQAGGLLLEDAEIERERGVVLEEWRSRLGAGKRISDALQPMLYHGSRYLERDPIGTEASLRGFTPEAVRRFYRDWYRPDRMAVIVAGDLDKAELAALEAQVAATFGDLANPEPVRAAPEFPLPDHAPLTAVLKDPEINDLSFLMIAKYADHEGERVGDYEAFLRRNLMVAAINERLGGISDRAPEVLGAGTGWERLTPTTAAWSLGAGLREGKVEEGLSALLDEVARLQRYGLTEPEVDRARAALEAGYAAYARQAEQEVSTDAVEELIRVFLNGEPIPGVAAEVWYARQILPEIGADDLAPLLDRWLEGSDVVALMAPERAAVPDQAALAAAVATLPTREVAPLAAAEPLPELVLAAPAPGKILSQTEDEVLGLTTWELSNGLRLHIKQTGYAEDQLMIQGWSEGGLSIVPDADYFAAALRESAQDGVANLTEQQLQRRMAGIEASAGAGINRWGEDFVGAGAASEAEEVLRLLHAELAAPRLRQEELNKNLELLREDLSRPVVSPEALFGRRFNALVWGSPLRIRPWVAEDVAEIKLADIERLHRERFGDMGDFEALIVGNLSPRQLKPLVLRWLASLPGSPRGPGAREQEGDDRARMAAGVQREVMYAGREPKARYRLRTHGGFVGGWEARTLIDALADLLVVRLREVLREEKGGVYGVGVGSGTWETPFQAAQITVDFTCDPARVEELRGEVFKVLAEFRDQPLPEAYTRNEQEINRRERELAVQTNGFWMGAIRGALSRGEDPSEILTWGDRNAAITPANIQRAAQDWIHLDQYTELILLPEPGAVEAPAGQ